VYWIEQGTSGGEEQLCFLEEQLCQRIINFLLKIKISLFLLNKIWMIRKNTKNFRVPQQHFRIKKCLVAFPFHLCILAYLGFFNFWRGRVFAQRKIF